MSCPVLWVKIPFYWSRCVLLRMRSHPEWFFLRVFLPLSIEPLLLWQFGNSFIGYWVTGLPSFESYFYLYSLGVVSSCSCASSLAYIWSSGLLHLSTLQAQVSKYWDTSTYTCAHTYSWIMFCAIRFDPVDNWPLLLLVFVKHYLQWQFEMKDVSPLCYFLGLKIS